MTSVIKIVGSGVNMLVLNIYPTDSQSEIVKRRVEDDLQEELRLLKKRLLHLRPIMSSGTMR